MANQIKGTMSNYTQNTKLNTHRNHGIEHLPGSADGHDFSPWQSNKENSNHLLQTSTNIFLYANRQIVGMVQSFSVSESRNINKLQAIGYEGVVQAVPSNTNGGTLNVSRMALYESNLWSALGLTDNGHAYNPTGSKVHRGDTHSGGHEYENFYNSTTSTGPANRLNTGSVFKTLKDQRVPIEIQVRTLKNGNSSEYYIERYVDCWLQSYSKSYSVGTITVAEQATISYADVY